MAQKFKDTHIDEKQQSVSNNIAISKSICYFCYVQEYVSWN
jgi:hypothetical protein